MILGPLSLVCPASALAIIAGVPPMVHLSPLSRALQTTSVNGYPWVLDQGHLIRGSGGLRSPAEGPVDQPLVALSLESLGAAMVLFGVAGLLIRLA
jgi:hypothetical protein